MDNHGPGGVVTGVCWEFSGWVWGFGLEVTTVTGREWRLGGRNE